MLAAMNSIRIAFVLILSAFAGVVPAAAAERRFAVTDFDRVVVEGPYQVRLATGRTTSAVASGSQAALDRLTLDVTGQTLRIRRNRNYWGGNPGAPEGVVAITITTRNLRSARLLGPARLEVDRVEGLSAGLFVEGSGLIRAGGVRADQLMIGLAGGGRIELAGTAQRLTADIQGSGDLAASGLRVEDATITSATSGSVIVAVNRSATVGAFGLGSIEVTGRPACTLRGPNAALVVCGSPVSRR